LCNKRPSRFGITGSDRYPEALALISAAVMEGARDGTKLVTVHQPIV